MWSGMVEPTWKKEGGGEGKEKGKKRERKGKEKGKKRERKGKEKKKDGGGISLANLHSLGLGGHFVLSFGKRRKKN